MGSGETSPTMVDTHRELFGRLGEEATAVLLETPYAFQENAAEISAKAKRYFGDSVGRRVEILSDLGTDADTMAAETALARLRAARWTFAGPGSPSYALDRWHPTQVPSALADLLQRGGCAVFASAAACTIGTRTLPVYEIYKCGRAPFWLEGLDLVAVAGLRVAVIPHYNNAEGGTHDTRFCYLGETRLARMERDLPPATFVLGVDEHTALILDLDARSATITGRGGVTVRCDGRSEVFPAGTTVGLDDLAAAATRSSAAGPSAPAPAAPPAEPGAGASPLLEQVRALEEAFDAALAARDVDAAVAAVLELDATLVDWSRDSLQSDEMDRARAVLRAMVVRLGEVARTGARDPAEVVGPFVDAVVAARTRAREARDWATADALRDRLAEAGVELRDSGEGTAWVLLDGD
jgi:hypothetical protein